MTRARKSMLLLAGFLAVFLVLLVLVAPSLQRSVFYPKPRSLPPVVNQTTEQLLNRLQTVLETNAPIVAKSLQAGLSDAQIAALETEGGFRLSEDLKELYRWHNGTASGSTNGLFPGQRFLPLDEAVREQTVMRQQLAAASLLQRLAGAVLTGHRTPWVHVVDDGAGDGYFFDPKRPEDGGAFFYYMAEEGFYQWFPSLRNFLAGMIECYESGAIKYSSNGIAFKVDFEQSQKIWNKFAKSSDNSK